MPSTIRNACLVVALTAALPMALDAHNPQEHQHPATHPAGGAHRHPQAAKLKNPVPANAASIAAGKQIYDKQCAGCHGDTGRGDGAMGEELNPKPANLVDADWKHGSTDGEIYVVIRDGVKNSGMKPYAGKLTSHEIWDVVNYLRSIGPAH
jgi:mono/diheme cytochrome c family protein